MEAKTLNIPGNENIPSTNIPAPYVLLGDDAYPLKTYLLKPYSRQRLGIEERIFNYRLKALDEYPSLHNVCIVNTEKFDDTTMQTPKYVAHIPDCMCHSPGKKMCALTNAKELQNWPNGSILDVLSDNNIFNNILNPTANPIAQKDIREMLQCFDPKADYPFTDDQQQERSKSMNSPESCITISYRKLTNFARKNMKRLQKN
nr:unnamed protein product [Callosobruchus analis]